VCSLGDCFPRAVHLLRYALLGGIGIRREMDERVFRTNPSSSNQKIACQESARICRPDRHIDTTVSTECLLFVFAPTSFVLGRIGRRFGLKSGERVGFGFEKRSVG